MKRRMFVALVSSLAGLCIFANLPESQTDGKNQGVVAREPVQVDSNALREYMLKSLKVTRENQKKFVNRVVAAVSLKKLPVRYVYASVRKAQGKRPDYPFPYFVITLGNLAKRANIEI